MAQLIPLLFRWRPKKTRRRRRQLAVRPIGDGDTLLYFGVNHRLTVTYDADRRQGCRIEDAALIVNLSQRPSARALAEEIRVELRLWYRRQARAYIGHRLDHWAEILHVAYSRYLITGPVSLWGSCNAKNEIRINWRIMMAPPAIVDYLLAHELCHVRHKDHSRRFWDLLASVMPDCKQRRQQLREMGPALFSQQG